MDMCPFWSVEDKVEICNKECPMLSLGEECIFQIYNANNTYVKGFKSEDDKELDI